MFHRKASGLTANPQAEDRRERTERRHQKCVIGACRGCANTDDLEHSVWVTMMRDRPEQLKLLLSENGPSGSIVTMLNRLISAQSRTNSSAGTALGVPSSGKVHTSNNEAKRFSTDRTYLEDAG